MMRKFTPGAARVATVGDIITRKETPGTMVPTPTGAGIVSGKENTPPAPVPATVAMLLPPFVKESVKEVLVTIVIM